MLARNKPDGLSLASQTPAIRPTPIGNHRHKCFLPCYDCRPVTKTGLDMTIHQVDHLRKFLKIHN